VLTPYSRLELVIEDSLKLAGLCLWAVYWIARAGAAIPKALPIRGREIG
jgi:hypothetical protein